MTATSAKTVLTAEQTRKLVDMEVRNQAIFVDAIGKGAVARRAVILAYRVAQAGVAAYCPTAYALTSDGSAYPCPGWNGMKIGNIATKSLQEIWGVSDAATQLRTVEKDDFKQCRGCELQNFCNMCPTYNYNENGGDMFKPCSRFCENAGLLRQSLIDRYNEQHPQP